MRRHRQEAASMLPAAYEEAARAGLLTVEVSPVRLLQWLMQCLWVT
jgi:hypothetical protein